MNEGQVPTASGWQDSPDIINTECAKQVKVMSGFSEALKLFGRIQHKAAKSLTNLMPKTTLHWSRRKIGGYNIQAQAYAYKLTYKECRILRTAKRLPRKFKKQIKRKCNGYLPYRFKYEYFDKYF